jgi:hypothetical protein
MAKSTSLFLPKNANNQSITLTSADTSVAKLCFTAGADDSNVKAILATTNDTSHNQSRHLPDPRRRRLPDWNRQRPGRVRDQWLGGHG